MAAVCLYFQIHQPFRLRRYSVFDTAPDYFDDNANAAIVRKVAEKCYQPANRTLLDLIRRHEGRFRVAMSISGVALESFALYAPAALEGFQALAQTGCVEFLGETYYHSLSILYSKPEFRQQVQQHQDAIRRYFQQTPRVFRNTELIFDNTVAQEAADLHFAGVLTEGWENVLRKKGPGWVYRSAKAPIKVLLRNYQLSDDVAFRFSRADWAEWPLTAEKFAQRIAQVNDGPVCNLFMDYETFGEHQWEQSGIFNFLDEMPGRLLEAGHGFVTPSELVGATPGPAVTPDPSAPAATEPAAPPAQGKKGAKKGVKKKKSGDASAAAGPAGHGNDLEAGAIDVPRAISWADEARDLSAWLGNAMQTHALQELYRLEPQVKRREDPKLLEDWRRLTTSDHVYYMSTKHYADGQVHSYFNPYESPYDAYINFMNVLDNLRARLRR